MNLKMPSKKILAPGLHLVTIKSVAVARSDKGEPASWVDHDDNGQRKGAIRVLFMGKNSFGIEHDFWQGKAHLYRDRALCAAIGVTPPVHKDSVIGKKLYVMVAKVLIFDGDVPRAGEDGKQAWFSKLIPQFWGAAEYPSVIGDPAQNGGVCSGDFLMHFRDGKYTTPPTAEFTQMEAPAVIQKTFKRFGR